MSQSLFPCDNGRKNVLIESWLPAQLELCIIEDVLDLERLGIPGPGDPGRDWLCVSLKNAKYVLQYVNILLQTFYMNFP